MKHIPKVAFQSLQNSKDFELLNLADLFSRDFASSDHNPALAHRISFFALILITKGTGKHQIDLKEYDLEAGTILKIAKGQIHAFEKDPSYQGYIILFTEDFVLNYFSKSSIQIISHLYNYHLSPPIAFDKKANESLIEALHKELQNKAAFAHKNILASLLDLYLLKLERKAINQQIPDKSTRHYDTFIQFKNLVETQYTSTRNVKDYADKLFISSKLLNQIVKEFTINTAKAFIDNYVILEAKREIVSTNKHFKEIAFQLGFDELTNFTKFFKNKMHLSPKEFRNKQID